VQPRELLARVVNVMADVLVHQRPRWGALLGHQRQYEGWWKAEMALAIESWSWREDQKDWPAYVWPEAKPKAVGFTGAPPTADLMVGRMNDTYTEFDTDARPRLWIELKERSTWWGTTPGRAAKAFGTGNNGIQHDLEKWHGVKGRGEVVVVSQVSTHDGTYQECFPKSWLDELDDIASKYERAIEPRCVGYEIAGRDETTGRDRVRWARFDAFVLSA
jgi:hypothetical protein